MSTQKEREAIAPLVAVFKAAMKWRNARNWVERDSRRTELRIACDDAANAGAMRIVDGYVEAMQKDAEKT